MAEAAREETGLPLLPDLIPIALVDGTVAEATPAQALLITNGQAPRLSEQVEFQSYEVAQSAETTIDENDGVLPLDRWGVFRVYGRLFLPGGTEPRPIQRVNEAN